MLGNLSLSFNNGDKTTIAIFEGSKFGIRFLLSETHQWDVAVTSHPVETGSEVSDHIQPQPRTVTITSRESEAPLNIIDVRRNGGRNRVDDAKVFLTELYRSRRPVLLTTRLHTYPRMVATSITQSSSAGDGKSMPWSVTFKEIEIADSQSIQLAALAKKEPPPAKGPASKTVEAGKKPPNPTTAPETEKAGSELYKLGKALKNKLAGPLL